MPQSNQRSVIPILMMIAMLSTGCGDSGFLKIFSTTQRTEYPTPVALSLHYPNSVIMANSTFSITPAITHSENEKPLWKSFQAKLDEVNKRYILSCQIQRSGSIPTGQSKISTTSITLRAPDITAASMFLFLPQVDCQNSLEMLKKFNDQNHTYDFSQTIYIQPRAIPSLLQTSSIPFRTIYSNYIPFEMPNENRILNSQSELDQFFVEHPSNLNDGQRNRVPPPVEAIDFSTEQVIVVSFGAQSTGMIDCKIAIIEEQADRLLVHPVRWLPISEFVNALVSFPCHLVVVKRSTKPIEFAPILDGFASENL
ncbi:MAG TPA: hypothetical protein DD435_15135 [Cyanobacteria bacterium UBA8530]|nr:hypothetical protein [Cyanobacteria bacterium UBA8530]